MVTSVRRAILGLVVLAGWSSCGLEVRAEGIGSPASILKKGKWMMGLNGGSAFARQMNGAAEATLYQAGHFRGYGLTDWLSIYGKIGAAYLEIDDATIKKTNDQSATNRFGVNVLSSGQIKARIWQSRSERLEWDGGLQYIDIRRRQKNKNELRWHEWQFATSVAGTVGRMRPYLGAKVSLLSVHFKVRESGQTISQGTYEHDVPVGLFFGTDVSLGAGEDVTLNVESAYTDGPELTMAIAYTF